MNRHKWTKEDINYLKDNWRNKSDQEIAEALNKSVSSVYSKRHRHGMMKNYNDADKHYHYGFKCSWRVKRLLDSVQSRRKTQFIRDCIEYANRTGFIKEYQ